MGEQFSGELRIAEGQGIAASISHRHSGPWTGLYMVMIGLMIAGAVVGLLFAQRFANRDAEIILFIAAGVFLGSLLYSRFFCPKIVQSNFRRNLKQRGVPEHFTTTVTFEADYLVSDSFGMQQRVPWPLVSEVYAAGGYWVILHGGIYTVVPKRWFDSPGAEKRFISLLLSHMTPEARARSADAVALSTSP